MSVIKTRKYDWFAAIIMGLLLASFTSAVAPLQAQQIDIAHTRLKVGDRAPDFSLLSDQWDTVKLSSFRAKKNVVLIFYVLAFSPD